MTTDTVIEPFSRLCETCDAKYEGEIHTTDVQYAIDADGWLLIRWRLSLCPPCRKVDR